MSDDLQQHAEALQNHFGDKIQQLIHAHDEITIDVAPGDLLAVSSALRDQAEFGYEQLIDLCGVD